MIIIESEKTYYENGQLKSEQTDNQDGTVYQEWYPDGTLRTEEHYNVKGEYHRVGKPAQLLYHPNSKLISESYFLNGELHNKSGFAKATFHPNGHLAKLMYFQNGKLHRIDGPALQEFYNAHEFGSDGLSLEQWFQDGELYNPNGPVTRKINRFGGNDYEEYLGREDGLVKTIYRYNDQVWSKQWKHGTETHIKTWDEKGYLEKEEWHKPFNLGNENEPAFIMKKPDGTIYKQYRNKDNMLHRTTGPAVEEYQGDNPTLKIWYNNGLSHRQNDPALQKWQNDIIILREWRQNGILHNKKGPALQKWDKNSSTTAFYENGNLRRLLTFSKNPNQSNYYLKSQEFFNENGELHNEFGSARSEWYPNGNLKLDEFYLNGSLHNENGAAYHRYDKNGHLIEEIHYINGEEHNKKGPSHQIWHNNTLIKQEYRTNNQLHNLHGFAIQEWDEYGRTQGSYWINGEPVSKSKIIFNQHKEKLLSLKNPSSKRVLKC